MNIILRDVTPWRNQATSKKREASSAACFMLIIQLSYFSTLKMEAARSSETLIKLLSDYAVSYPRRYYFQFFVKGNTKHYT
jgi:hypothetical protein